MSGGSLNDNSLEMRESTDFRNILTAYMIKGA